MASAGDHSAGRRRSRRPRAANAAPRNSRQASVPHARILALGQLTGRYAMRIARRWLPPLPPCPPRPLKVVFGHRCLPTTAAPGQRTTYASTPALKIAAPRRAAIATVARLPVKPINPVRPRRRNPGAAVSREVHRCSVSRLLLQNAPPRRTSPRRPGGKAEVVAPGAPVPPTAVLSSNTIPQRESPRFKMAPPALGSPMPP
jgi:hypothetical protein